MHAFSNTVMAISDTMHKHFTKYVSNVITTGTRMGALRVIQVTKSYQTGDKWLKIDRTSSRTHKDVWQDKRTRYRQKQEQKRTPYLWGSNSIKISGKENMKEGNCTSVLTTLIEELSHWAGHLPLQLQATKGHSHQC